MVEINQACALSTGCFSGDTAGFPVTIDGTAGPSYRLTGAHVTLPCRDCHGGGTFAGTPDQCVGCHWAQYVDPANTRDHVAEGFSTDCEDCHTTTGWLPATGPP